MDENSSKRYWINWLKRNYQTGIRRDYAKYNCQLFKNFWVCHSN